LEAPQRTRSPFQSLKTEQMGRQRLVYAIIPHSRVGWHLSGTVIRQLILIVWGQIGIFMQDRVYVDGGIFYYIVNGTAGTQQTVVSGD